MPTNSNELVDRMNEYRLLSDAEYIMVSHTSGAVIAEAGSLNFSDSTMFAALTAASYSSTTQIAQLLQEEGGFTHVIQMGKNRSLFMGALSDSCVAIFVVPGATINRVLYNNMQRWCDELHMMMGDFGQTTSLI